jgi:alkylation response protein AidB-like acyl-CoA dehydrogenase
MADRGPDEVARLLAAAEALGPLIAEHHETLARARDLPAEIADALRRSGLLAIWVPRGLGGSELSPADYVRVIEAVARQDGAVGWCAAIAASGARLAGALDEATAAELFGPDKTGIAGSVNPVGKAVAVDGGYRIDGRWSYGSFIRHSVGVLGMCVIHENGVPLRDENGAPLFCAAIVPTASVRIHDTWDTGGLRATGSHDFEMTDLLVPSRFVIPLPGFETRPRRPEPLYALPFVTAFTLGITPVPLGIARAVIDALVALACEKRPMGAPGLLRDLPGVQADVARAEALLRSARAFLFEAVADLWAEVSAGTPASLRNRALVRLACWNALQASKQAVTLMSEAAGGAALPESGPFARRLRDVQAAGQHMAFAQRNLEAMGRVLLGMPPGTARF